MSLSLDRFLFDTRDHDLLKMVHDVLHREVSRKNFQDLLNPYLHPHGIKEMAASQDFRIAHAVGIDGNQLFRFKWNCRDARYAGNKLVSEPRVVLKEALAFIYGERSWNDDAYGTFGKRERD